MSFNFCCAAARKSKVSRLLAWGVPCSARRRSLGMLPTRSMGQWPGSYRAMASLILWPRRSVAGSSSAGLSAPSTRPSPQLPVCCTATLGGVDGFDDDEAKSKCDEGSEVLVRLLAAERHPLEALQLAHKLLDAGAGAIERLREERRPVLGR